MYTFQVWYTLFLDVCMKRIGILHLKQFPEVTNEWQSGAALLLKYHIHLMWFSQTSYDALTTASLLDFILVTFLSLDLMIKKKIALYVLDISKISTIIQVLGLLTLYRKL